MIVGQLRHPLTGDMKNAHVGFSWTMLFFGGFVPLVRKDLKWAVLSWILAVCTLGIFWIYFPFVYNGVYTRGLVDRGYQAMDRGLATSIGYRIGRTLDVYKA